MTGTMQTSRTRTRLQWILASLGIAIFCAAYPMWVIRPFRPQGARELVVALEVLRIRPIVAVLCFITAIVATVLYCRAQPRRLARFGALALLAATGVFAGLCFVNVYEIMFHPVPQPAFASISETKLDADERVVAVNISGSARAYPVRIIAYHHMVNDTVGGVPIIATY
jgi:Protein of unknown function (DUF3179)